MPTIHDLSQSKYLQQPDVTPDITVTIEKYERTNLAKEGQTKEMKYCLHFLGDAKPLSLNKCNGELIALSLGNEDLDAWIGKQITLYADPTIMFQGKRTGGIRVRYIAPGQAPPQQQAPVSQFTADNNIANPPRTDDSGPLPTEPDPTIPF